MNVATLILQFEVTRRPTRANPVVSSHKKLLINPLQVAAINDTPEGAQIVIAGGLAFDVIETYDEIIKRMTALLFAASE